MEIPSEWSIYMKNSAKRLVPILLVFLIIASVFWYCFVYDRDFTRDMLLQQARYHSTNGNPKIASWFYDLAYRHSGQDENVAIELANQFKADGNYTKAEYTLSNAIADGGTAELYIALCKTYVEQDKLLDAVNMLDNIADASIKAEIDAVRPAAPVADPLPGFYSEYIPVSLSTPSGTIYYTTNGEYPSVEDAPFTDAVTLGGGETLIYAVSVDDNGLVSPRSIYAYTVGGVIEEVMFEDSAIESAVRQLIGRNDGEPLYTSELWNISSFSVPKEAKYCDDLTKLSYLKSLEISDQTFDSLRFLSSLSSLTELTITDCRFGAEELSVIAALPNLQHLTLSNCGLSTVSGLENAQSLISLNLANNTVRNLEPIARMVKLQDLDLQHNALTGLNSLSGLNELQKLNVSYNSLTSLAPLATCTKLAWLDVNNNEIGTLSGINNLPLLSYLAANHNNLSDLSLLSESIMLTELYVADNELTDITCLGSLNNLEVLDFSSNQIEVLPAWSNDASLRIIDGSHNKVSSLANLKNQMNLTHVYMDYNAITSVSDLQNCYKLVMVNVYGNKIDGVRELTDHDIIVNWDPT